MTTYYKYLDEDGQSCHGGHCQWSLPTQNEDGTWKPGDWMPAIQGKLMLCENGYHLCEASDLPEWFASVLYVAEGRGDSVRGENKVIFRESRLLRPVETYTDRTQRLFACDCAEHVLRHFEEKYPADPRPREAIAVARRYANGDASDDELAAANVSAWAAARITSKTTTDTARAAVWAAADTTADIPAEAAKTAANDAIRAAAWAAVKTTWDAAWDAARATERQWQITRLLGLLEIETKNE